VRIIVAHIVRLQDIEAVAYCQPRRNNEKTAGKSAVRMTYGVQSLPGDDHRHNRGFIGSGRQLQRDPREARVGFVVYPCEVFDLFAAGSLAVWSDLCEPDQALDGFYLAEEGAYRREAVRVAPKGEQECGRG